MSALCAWRRSTDTGRSYGMIIPAYDRVQDGRFDATLMRERASPWIRPYRRGRTPRGLGEEPCRPFPVADRGAEVGAEASATDGANVCPSMLAVKTASARQRRMGSASGVPNSQRRNPTASIPRCSATRRRRLTEPCETEPIRKGAHLSSYGTNRSCLIRLSGRMPPRSQDCQDQCLPDGRSPRTLNTARTAPPSLAPPSGS
jgi:hypothetical protein